MYQYKSEILTTSVKWIIDTPNQTDFLNLDKLINLRSSEGWELATYMYVRSNLFSKSSFSVTFRKLT